jgi:hypothetical protein
MATFGNETNSASDLTPALILSMGINAELWNKLVDGSRGDSQDLLKSFAIACHENEGIFVHICATKKGADGSTKTSM